MKIIKIKKLPSSTSIPKQPSFKLTSHSKNLKLFVEKILKIIQDLLRIFGFQQIENKQTNYLMIF